MGSWSHNAPAEPRAVNAEGLKRRGFSPERIDAVKQMYRMLYRKSLTLDQARAELAVLAGAAPAAAEDVAAMLGFLAAATRGIVR